MAEQPMSTDEFDDYMDGLTIREQNQVLGVQVDAARQGASAADKFNAKLERLILRLVWIVAWGWQVFTFGWPAALLIKWIDNHLAKGKKDA